MIRDIYAVTKPLTAAGVKTTLSSLNEIIRVRLRLWEFVPLEWSGYTIGTWPVFRMLYESLAYSCSKIMAAFTSLAKISFQRLLA